MEIYGLPQPLTGNELITVHQMQGGQLAKCTVPLSQLLSFFTAWATSLPTTTPSEPGVLWNNNGVVSIT